MIKIKDLESVAGLVTGYMGNYVLSYEDIRQFPSYSPSTNSYGFSQYLTFSKTDYYNINEKQVYFFLHRFTNYPYFDPDVTVTSVYDDVIHFANSHNPNLINLQELGFIEEKRILSSLKIDESHYIITVLQASGSDSRYSGIISYICDKPDFIYNGIITDYGRPYTTVGSGTFEYFILCSYELGSQSIHWGYIDLTPVYIQTSKNYDDFYSDDSDIVFYPCTLVIADNNRLRPDSYPSSSAEADADPTYIGYHTYVWSLQGLNDVFGIDIVEPEDPTEPVDPVFPYYPPSDPVDPPSPPPVNPITSGLVKGYKMDTTKLVQLHDELFPTFTEDDFNENPLVNLANEIKWIWNTIKSGQSNSYIISCHGIPVTPLTGGSESIKLGNFTYTTSAPIITNGYVDFNFGSVQLAELYHGFEDYAYTDIQLYLPFGIGYVPLPNEYIQDGIVEVLYRFNVADGSFIAYVICTSSKSNLKASVTKQYTGSAVSNIPMTGSNYSQLISNVVTSGVASAIAQNPVPLVNEGLNLINEMQPLPRGNNDIASSPALMTIRNPYLIISRTMSQYPTDYSSINGLPAIESGKLSQFKGYTECIVNVDKLDFNAPDEDKTEIVNLLRQGIII